MNMNTLEAINTTGAKLVVPKAVADKLPNQFRTGTYVMDNGEARSIDGIPVTALPMYNLPELVNSRHPKDRGKLFKNNKRVIKNFVKKEDIWYGDNKSMAELLRYIETLSN